MYFDVRKGRKKKESNPFKKQLGKCFIFNDEFHSLRVLYFTSCFKCLDQNNRTRISVTSDVRVNFKNYWTQIIFIDVVAYKEIHTILGLLTL